MKQIIPTHLSSGADPTANGTEDWYRYAINGQQRPTTASERALLQSLYVTARSIGLDEGNNWLPQVKKALAEGVIPPFLITNFMVYLHHHHGIDVTAIQQNVDAETKNDSSEPIE